jgi:hypothetical protein
MGDPRAPHHARKGGLRRRVTLFPALRRALWQRIVPVRRDPEQLCDQRHGLVECVGAACQQSFELTELHLRWVIALDNGRALQLLDHRM